MPLVPDPPPGPVNWSTKETPERSFFVYCTVCNPEGCRYTESHDLRNRPRREERSGAAQQTASRRTAREWDCFIRQPRAAVPAAATTHC